MRRVIPACLLGIYAVAGVAQDAEPESTSASVSPSASAAIQDRWYLSPTASFIHADSGRRTDDGYGAAIAIGKRLAPEFLVELNGAYNSLDPAKISAVSANALFFPSRGAGYGLAGVGVAEVKSHPGAVDRYHPLLLNIGGGYLFGPFDFAVRGIAIRTEVVYRIDAHNDQRTGETQRAGRKAFDDVLLSVGLVIPLGMFQSLAQPAAPPAVEVVAVADGEASSARAPEPSPAPVCNAPGPGGKLDVAGCGTGDVIVLEGVNFDYDKDQLTANARTILDGLAASLNAAPQVNVEIGGHTDARGSDEYNAGLSERRACAVARYLGDKGVEAGRLTPHGYGETKPVAENDSEPVREQNRRVELKILEGPGTGLSECGRQVVSASPSTASSAPVAAAIDAALAPSPKEAVVDAPPIEPESTSISSEEAISSPPSPASTSAAPSAAPALVADDQVFGDASPAAAPTRQEPQVMGEAPKLVPREEVFGSP